MFTAKIGYMTFREPQKLSDNADYRAIRSYLQEVTARSLLDERFQQELDFDVVAGNHYQIFSWLKNGLIDGAVCSAAIAQFLHERGGFEFVAEFDQGDERSGYEAVVVGPGTDGSAKQLAAFQTTLSDIWQRRRATDPTTPPIQFVAHPSATGFLSPLLHADRFLAAQGIGRSSADAELFWDRFFRNITFTLRHNGQSPFTFRKERSDGATYELQRQGAGSTNVLVPHDVLVLRRSIAQQLSGLRHWEDEKDNPWIAPFVAPPGSIYQRPRVVDFSKSVRFEFKRRMDELREWKGIASRFRHWFEEDRYQFTVGETLGFLRNDMTDSGEDDLALVLSGGGVKGAYQARLLDRLYERDLVNTRDAAPLAVPDPKAPLIVRHVVGTSGGAIVGLFTAHKGPQGPMLASQWVNDQNDTVVASIDQVFAEWDLLRWVSLWCVLAFLRLFLRVLGRLPVLGAPEGTRRLPIVVDFVLCAVLVVVPLVSRLSANWRESTFLVEGIVYFVLVLLIHAALSCCVLNNSAVTKRRHDAVWKALSLAGIIVLLTGVWTFVAATRSSTVLTDAPQRPVLAIYAGAIILLSAVLRASHSGVAGLQLLDVRLHAKATGLALLFCAVTYVVARVSFALTGLATTLEMTFAYWLGLMLSALVVAIALTWLAGRRPWLRTLLEYLVTPRDGHLRRSALTTLVAVLGAAVFTWTFIVATGVYGNDKARAALLNELTNIQNRKAVLRTDFVVATSALTAEPLLRPETAEMPPEVLTRGDWFFCLPYKDGCVGFGGANSFVSQRPGTEDIVSLVLASGSPFPIFPAHHVSVRVNGRGPDTATVHRFDGALVDGGYAHQEAIAAAALSGARQVLLVRASPADDGRSGAAETIRGPLARHLLKIFDFMFSRSQELDRSIGKNLVVASLTPSSEGGDFPFLMDFRPQEVRRVDQAAKADWDQKRRIGAIEGWGRPELFDTVRFMPERKYLLLPRRGWQRRPRVHLIKDLSELPAGRVAVFDLDGTCLKGDIGEAVFKKQVKERRYAADSKELQALFEDDLRPKALDPETPNEERLKLFEEQYARIKNTTPGMSPTNAYAWITRLLGGMTIEDVEDLTRSAMKESPDLALFAEIADLMRALMDRGWQVWIVSASNQYSVEVVADALSVPRNHVIAGRLVKKPNGVLGFDIDGEFPNAAGKARALQRAGLVPDLVVGDSMGDFEMMQASRSIVLVVDHDEKIPADAVRESGSPLWIRQSQALLTTTDPPASTATDVADHGGRPAILKVAAVAPKAR